MSAAAPFSIEIVPVTPFQQNCAILRTPSGKAVVVDPGGEPDKIMKAAARIGAKIEKIWLTHGHLDHAGAAEEIKRRTGAPIEGPHQDEVFWLQQIRASWRAFGIEDGEDCTPDRFLGDGDALEIDGIAFEVVHTPGHTPGHVVIFNRAEQFAFVGDVLFAGSIGRTDFPRGDHATLIRSITEKLWPLGSEMRFLPGHGPMSTFGRERASNPFVADAVTGYGGAAKTAGDDLAQRLSKRWT